MEKQVEVAIIGAGTAGLNAMGQVRRRTDSFVLINGGELGTTCARVGCMPSKALIQVAEDFHRRHIFDRHGTSGGEGLQVDWAEAMEHVRDLRDNFVDRVLSSTTDEMGEEFIEGYARFVEPDLLEIDDGQRIRAKKIVVATGSRPVVPEPWRAFGDRVITTDELFELETLPRSMAVVGLGVIGLELGQALARLGVEVTGIDRLETIGGLQDPVVSQTAVEVIGRDFPLWLGESAELVGEGDRIKVVAGEREVVVDKVLVSMGRRPNLDRLGLEVLGLELDTHGIPPFNPFTMQVDGLPIFIAGDVTGSRAVLHEAADEGRIAGFNAMRDEPMAFRRKPLLAINFCDPNIATVGMRWAEMDHDRVAIGAMRMGPMGRALIAGKNQGVIRLYAEKEGGRLLGAEMIAFKAEDLAHFLTLAIHQKMTVFELLSTPFYHPTLEEAIQSALRDLLGKVSGAPDHPVDLIPLDEAE